MAHIAESRLQPASRLGSHALFLMVLAERSAGAIVEVGVGHGYSTEALLAGALVSGQRLTSYDHTETTYHLARETMGDELAAEVTRRDLWGFLPVQGTDGARDHVNGTVGLLFLDGSHTYEDTAAELAAWAPKMSPDGIICGHDHDPAQDAARGWGVCRAVAEFAGTHMFRYRLQVMDWDMGLFILWPRDLRREARR
jgi:predicted O-methyltransferase YrrM